MGDPTWDPSVQHDWWDSYMEHVRKDTTHGTFFTISCFERMHEGKYMCNAWHRDDLWRDCTTESMYGTDSMILQLQHSGINHYDVRTEVLEASEEDLMIRSKLHLRQNEI